jgi:hypothetical protein
MCASSTFGMCERRPEEARAEKGLSRIYVRRQWSPLVAEGSNRLAHHRGGDVL